MKNFNFILFLLCIGFLSCEQHKIDTQYCVNIIRNSPDSLILSESELDTIKSLFDYNQLEFNKYQFTKLQYDDFGNYSVRCEQFANGLRLFLDELAFHFDEKNNLKHLSGDIVEEVDLNTEESMNYNRVVEEFLYLIEQDNYYRDDIEELKDNCFDVEFGYYDLNNTTSRPDVDFTKAWKIKLADKRNPYAFINDENSEKIYYDNGTRF